jgi:spore germination protein GerM
VSRRRLLVCILVASHLAACGVKAEGEAKARSDDDVPFGLLDEGAPPLVPPTSSSPSEGVPLCFIDGEDLAVVIADLDRPADLTTVVDALAEPPEGSGRNLRTAMGDQRLVADVSLAGGVAKVELRPAIATLSGDEQLLAVAQVVCTLTGQPGVGPVSFFLDGASVDVPRGDGSLTSEPVSRDDYADLLQRAGA